jgi:hypoxanthine phosphoribosyltransferase
VQSYDYARRDGVEAISWERFAELTARLTEALASHEVEGIVGIARAGLFPATAVACSLRCELFPTRVTRRVNDQVTYQRPVWKVDVSPEVGGRRVAVVDEIADTGETLALVTARARERGAAHVLTACLVSHSWADPAPEIVGLVSDALVLFPWDRRVFLDGRWQAHPELVAALAEQGVDAHTLA